MAVVNTGRPLITLMTDYGEQDNYVAIIKATILGLNPKAIMVDISHLLPPYNVSAANYLMETSCGYFPPGTTHLAVVDSGVGTSRKAILIETGTHLFIGPNNGLFSFIDKAAIKQIISLENKKYFLGEISATFHGRDIFAPVAGYLSLGIAPEEFGPRIKSIYRIPSSNLRTRGNFIIGKVIYIDYFGNLVTSLKKEDLPKGRFLIYLNDKRIGSLKNTFGSVETGKPLCYINSFGYLEIAIREESAAEYFDIDYDADSNILVAQA
jgi:S-adenosylmethionine hydrolase